MSHPPPYTFRMKIKYKVRLYSEPNSSAVSLTPRSSPRRLSGQLEVMPPGHCHDLAPHDFAFSASVRVSAVFSPVAISVFTCPEGFRGPCSSVVSFPLCVLCVLLRQKPPILTVNNAN